MGHAIFKLRLSKYVSSIALKRITCQLDLVSRLRQTITMEMGDITFIQGLFHQKNINIQCRFSWQSALVSTSNCDYDTNAFHIWTHLCRGALKSSIERDQMWDSPGNSTFHVSY